MDQLFAAIGFLFSFNGRIGRLAYWAYHFGVLAGFIVAIKILPEFGFPPPVAPNEAVDVNDLQLFVIVFFLLLAGYIWVTLAVTAKRWHDRGKSGLWSLIWLLPIGPLWLVFECGFLRGTDGPNRYGDDPRGPNLVEVFD